MKKKVISMLLILLMIVCTVGQMPKANAVYVSGQDIVNKAMEYIGKVPYVWGGTKIDGTNPGADCSGFICRIYEKFGINMWANRTKLRNCGTNLGTNLSVAQLGDIIWFDGHVAIYAGKDSKGNHTIVHETSGSFKNVVHTKVSVVNAELKGIIRIPGVNGYASSSSNTPNVTFSKATDSKYTSKQKVTDTNAVIVNKITKPSGTSVTKMGVYLYDSSGNLLKKYSENISNVSASTTTYHSWYDINAELGITLKPGTLYKYSFFGVFNGVEISGSRYTFQTTGTALPETYTLYLHINDSLSDVKKLTQGQPYGSMYTPELEGYTFDGWYTASSGGSLITSSTIFNGSSDVHLYPHFTKIEVVQPETYTVTFINLNDMTTYGTYTVSNGDTYTIPSSTPVREGYIFDGWYTSSSGGTEITSSSIVNLTKNQNLYPHWTKAPVESDENIITLQINSPYLYINGKRNTIDDQGTTPLLYDNRTLLPVRAVVEAMGGTVNWIDSSRTVVMTIGDKSLNLQIGSKTAWSSSGEQYSIDVAPIIIMSRTMLPIRFIVEYFDGEVLWNSSNQTVTIQYTT